MPFLGGKNGIARQLSRRDNRIKKNTPILLSTPKSAEIDDQDRKYSKDRHGKGRARLRNDRIEEERKR